MRALGGPSAPMAGMRWIVCEKLGPEGPPTNDLHVQELRRRIDLKKERPAALFLFTASTDV